MKIYILVKNYLLNLYINLYILLLIIKKKLIFFRKNKLN